MKYEIPIAPMGKPRMVRSDRWKKRPVVQRYWSFKDELVDLCGKAGYVQGERIFFTVHVKMPKVSKKKAAEMLLTPKKTKPDLDNYLKSLMDILMPPGEGGDQSIHFGCCNKIWSAESKIVFYDNFREWMEDNIAYLE